MRWQFDSAAAFSDDQVPEEWFRYVRGVMDLILDPARILGALDNEPIRQH